MISDLQARLLTSSSLAAIWRVSWTGSADLYYVYVDGVRAGTTSVLWFDVTVAPGASPIIDVFDSAAAVPEPVYPDGVTLAWYSAGDDVATYRIEKYVGTDWIVQASAGPAWYQTWKSGRIADDTTHTYRIVPVGINGNDGPAVQFVALVVHHPDAPQVDMTYDAGDGTLTISAA